jgi:hypothetical protein
MDHQTNKQEPSSTEGGEVSERRYREVTEADIGKLIEVTDYGQQFEYRAWKEKRLAKLKKISHYPFRTSTGEAFRFARIEVQGE